MNCEKCQNKIEESHKFCAHCGESIKKKEEIKKTETKTEPISEQELIIKNAGREIKTVSWILGLGILLFFIILIIPAFKNKSEETNDLGNKQENHVTIPTTKEQLPSNIIETTKVLASDTEVKKYGEIIIEKLADGMSKIDAISSYANDAIKIADNRILELSSGVSKNEPYIVVAHEMGWDEFEKFAINLNNLFKEDVEYSQKVKDYMTILKKNCEQWSNSLETMFDGFLGGNKNMSEEELKELVLAFDVINKSVNETWVKQEELARTFDSENIKRLNIYKKSLSDLKVAIDYLSSKYNDYQRSQYHFTSIPVVTFPVVNTPQYTKCSFHKYYGVNSGGTISCSSY